MKSLRYPREPYTKGDDVKYDVNDPKPVIDLKIVR